MQSLAKAVWDFCSTSALLEELSARPVLRRLCGFEGLGDIPSESGFSRVFSRFGGDETAQRVFEKFTGRTFGGALVHNPGVDSPAIPVNPRRLGAGNGPEMEPDCARRFRTWFGVERVFKLLE